MDKKTILHRLRNPWGYGEEVLRKTRLAAADLIERQAVDKEKNMISTITWRVPNGEIPDGDLLVEVDTHDGSDCALVYIDDEDLNTLIHSDDLGDVWTAWQWCDVSRYAVMEEVLLRG